MSSTKTHSTLFGKSASEVQGMGQLMGQMGYRMDKHVDKLLGAHHARLQPPCSTWWPGV